MPIWARAIIFSIELVGFIILFAFVTSRFYKRHSEKGKKYAIKNLKFNLIYFLINFSIILAIFLFSYPTLIFLSYNKLILVSLVELASISIILFSFLEFKQIRDTIILFIIVASFILILLISIDGIFGINNFIIEDKVTIVKQTQIEMITPAVISENQIGYTADMEGNRKTYIFYYKEGDVWQYVEVKASEAKVERIKDTNSYVERTVTTTSYCNKEKKPFEEDYIYSEKSEKYVIYLNLKQMVEINQNN